MFGDLWIFTLHKKEKADSLHFAANEQVANFQGYNLIELKVFVLLCFLAPLGSISGFLGFEIIQELCWSWMDSNLKALHHTGSSKSWAYSLHMFANVCSQHWIRNLGPLHLYITHVYEILYQLSILYESILFSTT